LSRDGSALLAIIEDTLTLGLDELLGVEMDYSGLAGSK